MSDFEDYPDPFCSDDPYCSDPGRTIGALTRDPRIARMCAEMMFYRLMDGCSIETCAEMVENVLTPFEGMRTDQITEIIEAMETTSSI